jgi:acetyltransferase-like isoleucine patch superfamily enzyme
MVGKATYGPIEVLYDSGTARLSIGNYCSIASNVKFFLGGGHNYRKISTFPFQTKVYKGYGSSNRTEKLDIIVEDDVWIGYDCIILSGSRIGKGSVIGARSVVTGIIPPYSVYVGNKGKQPILTYCKKK